MIIYGASDIGQCTKRLVAIRMDYAKLPPPPDMQRVFDAGHRYEAELIGRLLDKGVAIDCLTAEKSCMGRWDTCTQHEVVLGITNEVRVVCHLDGLLPDAIAEVKSKSATEYAKIPHNNNIWDTGDPLIENYKWQISAYMNAAKMPAVVFFGNRDTDEYFEVVVEKPFYSTAEIRARVLAIEALARQGLLPESCDNKMYPCPVYYVTRCQGEVEMGNKEISALGVTYKRQVAAKKAAEAREKEIRQQLIAATGEDGIVEKAYVDGGTRVTFFKGRSRKVVDWEQVAEDYGVDVEKYQKPGSEYQAIRVTVKDEAE